MAEVGREAARLPLTAHAVTDGLRALTALEGYGVGCGGSSALLSSFAFLLP